MCACVRVRACVRVCLAERSVALESLSLPFEVLVESVPARQVALEDLDCTQTIRALLGRWAGWD